MNRRSKLRAARLAGGVLILGAVVPGFAAGAALAADAPADPTQVTATAEATDTSYVDEVAIGTAVKIAAPGVVDDKAVVKAADATTSATPPPTDEATVTATPSDAEVIETDSRQNASEDPTEVAVLGTKIGSNQLASTGPSQVTTQALVALALIVGGIALRTGPGLVAAAARRRH